MDEGFWVKEPRESTRADVADLVKKYAELRKKAQQVVDAFHSDSGEYSKMMTVCQLDMHLKGEEK